MAAGLMNYGASPRREERVIPDLTNLSLISIGKAGYTCTRYIYQNAEICTALMF
jgi:hypothetical protein